VKRFLPDTSCLVATVCSWHEHHRATVEELARRARQRETIVMAAPALIETYAVLTRLPPPYRMRPADALAVMEGNWSHIEVTAVAGTDIWPLLRALPEPGIAGGSTYDAVVATCARKSGVDVILTWNVAHFERVAEDIDVRPPRERA
jgi:predicted nucleic acid-binding protein